MATAETFFTGTPDQWWEQAEPILESEAAFRAEGTWYIVAESRSGERTGNFRISRPSTAGNHARRDALLRKEAAGEIRPDDIAPNVRALIRVAVERAEWKDADLLIADAEIGSSTRVPWRRKNARWLQVFDATRSASERTMSELNPVLAAINELAEEGSS